MRSRSVRSCRRTVDTVVVPFTSSYLTHCMRITPPKAVGYSPPDVHAEVVRHLASTHHTMRTSFRSPAVLLAMAFTSWAHGQFGAAQIIDNSATAVGITSIASADLNNDGLPDVVTSNGYSTGHITAYLQTGSGLGNATPILIDTVAFLAEEVTTADLNGDGWTDVVAVCRLNNEVVWYPNANGAFNERIVLDNASPSLNGVVAGDVDGNGSMDLVVIGQHLIDLYRNDGTGTFTKEAILTTSTSPNILECMDLVLADIDNDGDLDPVTAESLGGVDYRNAGNGSFTPETVDPVMDIMLRVRLGDVDGDGDLDMVLTDFIGNLRWYRNDGLTWASEGAMLSGTTAKGFGVLDMDGDGLTDLIVAADGQITYHRGLGNGSFAVPSLVHDGGSAFLDEVILADVNNDGRPDVLWSAPAGTLAYDINELPTVIPAVEAAASFAIYPDPDMEHITVRFPGNAAQRMTLLDVQGRPLRTLQKFHSGDRIDLHALAAGVYLLQAESGETVRWVKP